MGDVRQDTGGIMQQLHEILGGVGWLLIGVDAAAPAIPQTGGGG